MAFLAALPALLIFLALIGVAFYFLRRSQKQSGDAFQQLAVRLQFTHVVLAKAQAQKMARQFQAFSLFQSQNKIQDFVQGQHGPVRVNIMHVSSGMWGVDRHYTDNYALVVLTASVFNIPAFHLYHPWSRMEDKLNEKLFGAKPEVSILDYPFLAENYRLLCSEQRMVERWFHRGVGQNLNNLLRQFSVYYQIEGNGRYLVVYQLQKKTPTVPELQQLYEHSLQISGALTTAAI